MNSNSHLDTHPSRRRGAVRKLLTSCFAVFSVSFQVHAAIVAPNQQINGISQAELSARWWQWVISFPDGTNPARDMTGEFGHLGSNQAASAHPGIFFLSGNFSITPDFPDRTFTAPAGEYLFFNLATVVSVIPFFGRTEAEIRADAALGLGSVNDLFVSLNGVALESPANLLNYRQLSPPGLFNLTIPPNNIYNAPPGTYPAVSDGYFVALTPFSPGTYDLYFGGSGTGGGIDPAFDTAQTVHLMIVPEPGHILLLSVAAVLVIATGRGKLRSMPICSAGLPATRRWVRVSFRR